MGKIGDKTIKGSKIGIWNRQLAVMKLLNKGYSAHQIYAKLKDTFDTKESTIRKDIHEILNNWSKELDKTKNKLRTKYIFRIEDMVRENLELGNYKIALEAQKELNRITGMYDGEVRETDPIKVITIKEVQPVSVTGRTEEDGSEGS